jgi:hypothetical protein
MSSECSFDEFSCTGKKFRASVNHGGKACILLVTMNFRCSRIVAKSDIYQPVCPLVRMEHLGSHRKELHQIWYLSFCRKSVEKIKVFFLNLTRITSTLHEDH